MKGKIRFVFSALMIATMVFSVTATAAAMLIPANDKAGDHPPTAPPALEKIVFIHHKKGFAKPGTECGNGVCEPGENANKCPADCGGGVVESNCYTFLGRGVKWNDLPVNYVINPDNPDGLSQNFVASAIQAGADEWDSHTSTELFSGYMIDYNATWDDKIPDNRNEMVFGEYSQSGVIAVTVIWGYFSGPPSQRRIMEFDILFDTDFTWGDATTDPSVMDLQNIATHEMGHGIGLGDLYETTCIYETMYGYSTEGETTKRDLHDGDIIGLQELYGA